MVNIGIKLYDNTIHQIGDITSVSGAETTITTIVDYQKKAEVEVLVGESAYSDKYNSIGTLLIQNLPPARAGEPRITLKFILDADYSLHINVISKGVLRKKVKIPKKNWSGTPVPGTLFPIDLSITETEKPDNRVPVKKDKDEETIHGTKNRDIIIPILIIASIIILVFFAVYFFFVLRPWDNVIVDRPEPTQAAPTEKIPAEDEPTPAGTEEVINIDTATTEPVKEEPVAVDVNKINNELESIGPIFFAPNSSQIKDPAERKKCELISLSIKDFKNDILLIINGHTAKAGSAGERQDLSLERALAVQKELISRGAITEENCRTKGFGSENPATPDPGKDQLNRRVELRVELYNR